MSDGHDDTSGEPKTKQQQQQQQQQQRHGGDGVLLYYKYIDLGEDRRAVVKEWYLHQCGVDGLRGRVRVALDGVNCTLGGSLAALRKHISSVKEHAILQGEDMDFKLSASRGARNSQAAQESGFTTLSVKAVKEVVSLGERGAGLSHLQGGRHVSPEEFHRLLRGQEDIAARRRRSWETHRDHVDTDAGRERVGGAATLARSRNAGPAAAEEVLDGEKERGCQVERERGRSVGDEVAARVGELAGDEEKEAVLLDVRNVYETSIGHFSAEGVERLDPKTRQFSDLPKWVDENVDHLRGKRVLMYCTGGVRCEMASALIRRQCDADATGTEVLQLSGGIERYLQAYPQRGEEDSARAEAAAPRSAVDPEGVEEGRGVNAGGERGGKAGGASPTVGDSSGGTTGGQGFFRGKNFVFDERVSVPEAPAGGVAIGRCLLCERPWDDYGSRSRCTRCRMLVLVCDRCVTRGARGFAEQEEAGKPAAPLPALQESPRQDDTAAAVGDCCPVGESGSRLPPPSPSPTPTTRLPTAKPLPPLSQEDARAASAATAVTTTRPQSTSSGDQAEGAGVGQNAEPAMEAAKAVGAEGVNSGGEIGLPALLCSACNSKRLQEERGSSRQTKGVL